MLLHSLLSISPLVISNLPPRTVTNPVLRREDMSSRYRYLMPFVLCILSLSVQSCGGGAGQTQETQVTQEVQETQAAISAVQPPVQQQAQVSASPQVLPSVEPQGQDSVQAQVQPTVQTQARPEAQIQDQAPILSQAGQQPVGVNFKTNTLRRVGGSGDNWCQTWASDDSVITAMDDGEWHTSEYKYHSRLYRITGQANNFNRSEVQNYPDYHTDGDGWFAYGVLSVDGVLYSLVSKTQTGAWSEGPFRGMKMLRSYDSGNSWYRVDRDNNDRFLDRWDISRESLAPEEMFFMEEHGRFGSGKTAFPFSYASFVQSGQDHRASKDGYVYIYSPEGSDSHQLLLARVQASQLGQRDAWQYFSGWNGSSPKWSSDIEDRQPNVALPERNSRGEYFGWYSWLPSVVWNPGLQVYVMVNGGTYAGDQLSNSTSDYYNKWMHTKSGSLGLWYSETPYGPWKQFYYTDHWTADDPDNLTYQPKLSPKWISDDGRTMTLIWSDAMRNAQGYSHSINYLWNQMEIELVTSQ